MTKKWAVMVGFLFTLFFVAGCTKAIPAEEAAPLLIDAMIYNQDTEEFQANFAKNKELTDAFNEHRTSFEENFTQGLLQTGEGIDEQLAADISGALMKQVKETTSYQVKKITETKPVYHVTYEIKGFHLVQLFKESTTELLARIQKDNQLVKDEKTLIATTVEIMKEKIPTITAKEDPTEVTLQLKLNQGKWEIVSGQEEALASLYLAFFSGVRTQEELTTEMTQAISDIVVPSMVEPKK